jgi:predicted ATPase/DNA-binding CsgD family transcriptional regulator
MARRRKRATKRRTVAGLGRVAGTLPVQPPRSRRGNLPRPLSSFVGRERELSDVKHLLDAGRVVTLTGSGGCGKTRLALRLAADVRGTYRDGVWLAELASISDPELVPKAVASALDIPEQPNRPLVDTLADYFQRRRALLVLDNCEHLRSACRELVETLLRAGDYVRILATSREALGAEGEVTYRVPSLRLPGTGETHAAAQLAEYDAIRLFAERAALARPDFVLTDHNAGTVTQICRRLDGLPLAIELAAARVRMLSVEQIATRLDDRFRLLTGGSRTALPRHETLRAAMDWSYGLLTDAERLLWRRLAVFSGGFTLEAAETVCAGDGAKVAEILDLLTSLTDKSLVIAEIPRGEFRYRLLETVRQYGWEKLRDSMEADGLRTRHLNWYVALAERAASGLWGPDQQLWMERLDVEHENLRSAMEWSKTEERGQEVALRIAGSVWPFWFARGYWSEGRIWLETGRSGDSGVSPPVQAKALIGAGFLAWRQGDYRGAALLGEQSLALCRALGDKRGIVLSLHNVAQAARYEGEYGLLAVLGAESLQAARELDDKFCVALSLWILAWDARRQCKYPEAMALYGESLRLCREVRDKRAIVSILIELGHVALAVDDCQAAAAAYEECLTIARELGHKGGLATTLTALGRVAIRQKNSERAKALCREALALGQELGDQYSIARTETVLGDAARDEGDIREAMRLYHDSLVLHYRLGAKVEIPLVLERLAATSSRSDRSRAGACLYGAAQALRDALGAPRPPATRADYDRDAAVMRRALGDEAFAAAGAEGSAMTLEQSIEYAAMAANAPPGGRAPERRSRTADGTWPLAPREREVAALVAEGLSNREIARRLAISERTAETHVQHILNKLNCGSRSQIAAWAVRHERTSEPQEKSAAGGREAAPS